MKIIMADWPETTIEAPLESHGLHQGSLSMIKIAK